MACSIQGVYYVYVCISHPLATLIWHMMCILYKGSDFFRLHLGKRNCTMATTQQNNRVAGFILVLYNFMNNASRNASSRSKRCLFDWLNITVSFIYSSRRQRKMKSGSNFEQRKHCFLYFCKPPFNYPCSTGYLLGPFCSRLASESISDHYFHTLCSAMGKEEQRRSLKSDFIEQ